MSKVYYSVLTQYGAQLFASAMAAHQPVRITEFAVGDGNGRAVQPDSTRTQLVRQVHRAAISAASPDPRNNKQVIFELTIPENIGGFWIREMGLYDATNRLVAYANCPDTYKPQLSEGSGKIQVIRMILLVSSSDAVTLSVDDSVIFATRSQLTPKTLTATTQNAVDETGHTHQIALGSTTQKGLVQLTDDTGLDSSELALTAKAGKKISQQISQVQVKAAELAGQKVDKTALSDAVNSDSRTNAASSKAVKTAYDKAVEAKESSVTKEGELHDIAVSWQGYDKGLNVRVDNSPLGRVAFHSEVVKREGNPHAIAMAWQSDGLRISVDNHDLGRVAFANSALSLKRVSLSERTLQMGNDFLYKNDSGRELHGLHFMEDAGEPNDGSRGNGQFWVGNIRTQHKGHSGYGEQYHSLAPFYVDESNSSYKDTYHPFIKGRVRRSGDFGAAFSFGYTTHQGEGDGFGRGVLELIEDNGKALLWQFDHEGNFHTPNDIVTGTGQSLNGFIGGNDYVKRIGNPHSIQLSWQSNGLNARVDNVDLGAIFFAQERLIWEGSTDQNLGLELGTGRGTLFVLLEASNGGAAGRPAWYSAPIAHCGGTRIGNIDTGGGDGDYNYSSTALLHRNGTQLVIEPLGEGRRPRIKKVVVIG